MIYKVRVTFYEIKSKLQIVNLSKVLPITIHKLRVTIHKLRVTFYELKINFLQVASLFLFYELQVGIHELQVMALFHLKTEAATRGVL